MTALEILSAVEERGIEMYWDARQNLLVVDPVDRLTPELDHAITANVRTLIRTVTLFGCRVGYRFLATRWHVVVRRKEYLETACRACISQDEAPVPVLPPYAPGEEVCARCIQQLVNRELARLPRISVDQRRSA